jgi:glutathione S-transferase
MKLYLNLTSPYARVIRVAVIEKQLENYLTLIWVDPWQSPDNLLEKNPAAKVPVLTTDDGQSLTETLLILCYLDRQWPVSPGIQENSQSLALLGLGQALIDAAFQTTIARKYDGNNADRHPLGQRRHQAISRGLAAIDQLLDKQASPGLGEIAVGVALAYLDFRLADVLWRQHFPHLAAWLDQLSTRRSFLETRFNHAD